MAARKNGPKAGPTIGISWENLSVGKPVKYNGTATGAKANASRANRRYPEMKFRTFQVVYVERVK